MSLTLIELVNVHTPEDFYEQLEAQLELEYALGHNLDAVYDALSGEVAGPVQILWHESGFSRVALDDWYLRVIDVLHTIAAERPDFTLSLE